MPDSSNIHADHHDPRLEACRRLAQQDDVTVDILSVRDDMWLATAWDTRHSIYIDAAAGLRPLVAVIRLAEQLHDGHPCLHCRRPTCIDDRLDPEPGDNLDTQWCEISYDPETGEYRRTCNR